MTDGAPSELNQLKARYVRRVDADTKQKYAPWLPEILMTRQEKERAAFRLFERVGFDDLPSRRVLEIGCGRGGKLHDLIGMGFSPENLFGNDLIPEFLEVARKRLPASVTLFEGDAREVPASADDFHLVYQSMVFSSILDDGFQRELAELMWSWTKPGGGILWYDFVYNNPRNQDVRGVPMNRVKELFPDGEITSRRVTLAPPISRRVARFGSAWYTATNATGLLRTHLLCFVKKAGVGEFAP